MTRSGPDGVGNGAGTTWLTLVVPEAEDDEDITVIVEGPAGALGLDDTPGDLRAAVGPCSGCGPWPGS